MQTLALVNNDLAIGGNGDYLTFSGVNRIRQDLTLALLEEYGSNRFHPKWGSNVKDFVGQINTSNVAAAVKAEINRVLQNYIIIQQTEVLRDTQFDVAGRFDTSDVIRNVQKIDVTTRYDSMFFSVAVQTLSRDVVTISRQAGL